MKSITMMNKTCFSCLAFIASFFLCVNICAAQLVTIPIETAENAYVLQTDVKGNLNTLYFGKKLKDISEYSNITGAYEPSGYSAALNAAYTSSGSINLFEPAISVTHADGNNSLDLKYISHHIEKIDDNVSLISVLLKDPVYDFEVTLYYKSYYIENVIEQWSVIRHNEKRPVILQNFASANLYLQGHYSYWLRQYHGDWANEMQPEEERLTHGIKTLDSKLGTRPNQFMPSVFMVSVDGQATENMGNVLFGALEWSGNFKIDFELDPQDNLKIIAGINNYASAYALKPSTTFKTPAFVYTFSHHGKGGASRNLQSWACNYKLPDGKADRLILLNNWETTGFDFNETKLKGLLKATKELGVDLFLLDDGWFGNQYSRNDDHQGLGDWQVNQQKLPNGIVSLTKEAEMDSVKFGIWIEPEMVNPKSNLYYKHNDWVVKQPGRAEFYMRNQLVLDLSNPDVQDFVYKTVDSLFIKAPGLAYIKWDCNSVIYNAYSVYLHNNQSQFYIDYVRGLYKVLDRIRKKYPQVPMMLCSSGGGRVDYGALQYFTEFWPSDNTDPIERIFIQWENSYFYPALTSVNHVTNWGKEPLKFRTDVAMMGKLGFDIDMSKLSNDDLNFCKGAVVNYSALKQIIWHGTQYRLTDPWKESVASVMYVDPEKSSAVVFNYLVDWRYGKGSNFPVLLNGLDPQKKYRLVEINLYPRTNTMIDSNQCYSGQYLMTVGFNPHVDALRTSVVIKVVEFHI